MGLKILRTLVRCLFLRGLRQHLFALHACSFGEVFDIWSEFRFESAPLYLRKHLEHRRVTIAYCHLSDVAYFLVFVSESWLDAGHLHPFVYPTTLASILPWSLLSCSLLGCWTSRHFRFSLIALINFSFR
jgi:hypothetical protein